jgi:hypothetical protein
MMVVDVPVDEVIVGPVSARVELCVAVMADVPARNAPSTSYIIRINLVIMFAHWQSLV